MHTFIISMITISVVSLVMKLITKEKQDKKTSSIYTFTVRPGSAITFIAIFCTTLFLAMMILAYFTGEESIYVYIGFGAFAAMGLFLLIETLPGAEEIRVDHDDILVQRAWFFKKHWSFSQIDYAVLDANKGIRVFAKGRKRQAFVVDNMCTGMTNFEKRLRHDNIEIREKIITPKDAEAEKKKWDRITWLVFGGIVLSCAIIYVLINLP